MTQGKQQHKRNPNETGHNNTKHSEKHIKGQKHNGQPAE
jgi:hypothetical protein